MPLKWNNSLEGVKTTELHRPSRRLPKDSGRPERIDHGIVPQAVNTPHKTAKAGSWLLPEAPGMSCRNSLSQEEDALLPHTAQLRTVIVFGPRDPFYMMSPVSIFFPNPHCPTKYPIPSLPSHLNSRLRRFSFRPPAPTRSVRAPHRHFSPSPVVDPKPGTPRQSG